MSELRKDPLLRRWVIIARERARRPGTFIDAHMRIHQKSVPAGECPFCNNQDPEIFALRDGDGPWKIKVVPHESPTLRIYDKFHRRGHGPYDVINAYGTHEVIIETPDHIPGMADLSEQQIKDVLSVYVQRLTEMRKNHNLRYAVIFKNYGLAAGDRQIGHARSHILATSVTPIRIKDKLIGAKRYFDYHDRCVYCDMVRQELEQKERIVTETEHFVCLTPFAYRFPFELMILPREHNSDFTKGIKGKGEDLAKLLKDILLRFKIGLDDPAFNLVIQTAPFRRARKNVKWQSLDEDYHWHIEIMPRLARAAGFEKGSGFYICAIPPEAAAEYLREVDLNQDAAPSQSCAAMT